MSIMPSKKTIPLERNSGLSPLICPQCGGHINRATYICEYCGTRFAHDETTVIKTVISRPEVRVLKANRFIENDIFQKVGAKEMSEIALKALAREMADCLMPMMDVSVKSENGGQLITARLRVVEPTYKF